MLERTWSGLRRTTNVVGTVGLCGNRIEGSRANKWGGRKDMSGISLSARSSTERMGLVGSGYARQRFRFAQMRVHWKP